MVFLILPIRSGKGNHGFEDFRRETMVKIIHYQGQYGGDGRATKKELLERSNLVHRKTGIYPFPLGPEKGEMEGE